jgi:hypothetical protein
MPIRMVATPLLGVGLLALMLIVHVGIADAQVKCWVPRHIEGPVTDKRWARHQKPFSNSHRSS